LSELDSSQDLQERVLQAISRATPLNIQGGSSKSFYGRPATGEPISVIPHRGIIEYEPTELVITARAGTALAEIETALAEKGQMFAFEPPHFGAAATLGGTIASGLAGPRRPYAGSVRDTVLGVKLINGRGEILSFGGQVIKNVAGFDVSRLQAGALGTLGLLLEISIRVMPRPESEQTLVFELEVGAALTAMNRWAGQHWPLSGACHHEGRLYLRLSGAEAALKASREKLGGEILPDNGRFWEELKEQRLDFFDDRTPLWRLSLPPASPQPNLPGDYLIDWGGALRWLKTDAPAETLFQLAQKAGGHASLFRHGERLGPIFQALPEGLKALHIKLKQAFDPHGIFNPSRMYEAW